MRKISFWAAVLGSFAVLAGLESRFEAILHAAFSEGHHASTERSLEAFSHIALVLGTVGLLLSIGTAMASRPQSVGQVWWAPLAVLLLVSAWMLFR